MKTALLRGREHDRVGEIHTVAEGPAAIAISRGGRSKRYPHTDPNEDAALFAWGEGGTLVAVADGHRGFEAAETALEHLLASPAPQWIEPGGVRTGSWERQVLAALCDANERVLSEARTPERPARTTLVLALVPRDQQIVLWASIGDSHVFRASESGAEELGAAAEGETAFLGHRSETPESLQAKCRCGAAPLGGARAVVLATDGLSEREVGVDDPAAAVHDASASAGSVAPALRARELVRGVVETALEAQRKNWSGDNVAVAAVWLDPAAS